MKDLERRFLLVDVSVLPEVFLNCLLYTSDAADELLCVDLGGRRIIKKKKTKKQTPISATALNIKKK